MDAERVTNFEFTRPQVQAMLDQGEDVFVIYVTNPEIVMARDEDWNDYKFEEQDKAAFAGDVFIVRRSQVEGKQITGPMVKCGNLAVADYDTWFEFIVAATYSSFLKMRRAERRVLLDLVAKGLAQKGPLTESAWHNIIRAGSSTPSAGEASPG